MNAVGRRCRQAGMVLLICLIFLTALTLLGLSASADTILQNKLTANLKESERAKQSALMALSWAEQWLLKLNGPVPEHCQEACDGLIIHEPGSLPPHPEFESFSWWMEQGHEAGTDPQTGSLISKIARDSIDRPMWIIEAAHTIPTAESSAANLQVWYRILARGSGQTGAAVSVIESTLVRFWPSGETLEVPDTEVANTCSGSDPTIECGRISWRELR
jgi:Tfp pilus assembly protein PilX